MFKKTRKTSKIHYVPFIALITLFVCYNPLSPLFICVLLNYAFVTAETISSAFEKAFNIWKKLQTTIKHVSFLYLNDLSYPPTQFKYRNAWLCIYIYIHFVYIHIFLYKIFSLIVTRNSHGVGDLSKSHGGFSFLARFNVAKLHSAFSGFGRRV